MAGKKSRSEIINLLVELGFDRTKLYYKNYSLLVQMKNDPYNYQWNDYRKIEYKEEEPIEIEDHKDNMVEIEIIDEDGEQATSDAGEALAAIVLPSIQNKISKIAIAAVSSARNELEAIVRDELAKNITRIEIKREGIEEHKEITGAHKQVPDLISLVAHNIPVYLYGAPGGGKSTAARHVSEALDLEFYYFAFSNQTTSSRLLGYMDANGKVVDTATTRSYKNGGLILFDEVDKASPAVLAEMHGMIANGQGSFPDGIFNMNKDWRVICAANTPGNGATIGHESSTKMDIAFRDRFAFIEWKYDTVLEKNIVLAIYDDYKAQIFLEWIWKVRKEIDNKKGAWKIVASPRASFIGAEVLKLGFKYPDAADAALFKGVDNELKTAVLNTVPLPV